MPELHARHACDLTVFLAYRRVGLHHRKEVDRFHTVTMTLVKVTFGPGGVGTGGLSAVSREETPRLEVSGMPANEPSRAAGESEAVQVALPLRQAPDGSKGGRTRSGRPVAGRRRPKKGRMEIEIDVGRISSSSGFAVTEVFTTRPHATAASVVP